MKSAAKKFIKAPLEVAEEFVKEAKKQLKTKTPPAPEEILPVGSGVAPKQAQKIQKGEEEELGRVRMEKAKLLAEWRQRYQKIQEEELRAAKQREAKEEEKKRAEEEAKKKKKKEKAMPSGEEAIAATGAAQKRPTGLWGIGGRFKKIFKWFTPERKGKAPS